MDTKGAIESVRIKRVEFRENMPGFLSPKTKKIVHKASFDCNVSNSGAPNVNFRKISVRKTIWDLEFSEHLLLNFLFACLA